MILTISKEGEGFVVDNKAMSGAPCVGRGKSMVKAIGDYFINNQTLLGYYFDVDPSAQKAEDKRRKKELAKR
jgi:hypothetical protein